MAEDHRKLAQEVAQGGILLDDDPSFLKVIVQRVLQELLEAEMTEHMALPPTSAVRTERATATATSQELCAQGWAR